MQYIVTIGKKHPRLAYLYALIGNLSLAVMQVLFKYATKTLPPFHVLAIRSAFLVFFNLYVLLKTGETPDVKSPESNP
jgi:drug/metabolite transporter (DMT)-like permease